jgi:molybdopterin-synthase adenylyltransferase
MNHSGIDRYRRQKNFRFIGDAGQRKLAAAKIAIVGVGALGTSIAERLARAGIGHLRLIDRDWVEYDNLARQTLFEESDAANRTPKSIAASVKLSRFNSEVTIDPQVVDFQPNNAVELVEGCDLILDGTDNFETRYLINDVSLEHSIPWVHGGVIGASGQVMTIIPGASCCLRCIIPDMPSSDATETCNTAGVVGPAVTMIASLQAMQAMKYLLSPESFVSKTHWITIDAWDASFRTLQADPQKLKPMCPACNGARDFLKGDYSRTSAILCGRNAVQIRSGQRQSIKLEDLAQRHANSKYDVNPFYFRLHLDDHELTIFRDGRSIVTGTEDPIVAKKLLAEWIGS